MNLLRRLHFLFLSFSFFLSFFLSFLLFLFFSSLFIFLSSFLSFFLKDFIYFIHERHRESEAETQAEGEAGSPQGAQFRTPSQDPRAGGRHSTTEPPRCPENIFFHSLFQPVFVESPPGLGPALGVVMQQ